MKILHRTKKKRKTKNKAFHFLTIFEAGVEHPLFCTLNISKKNHIMDDTLYKILQFADIAHGEQKRKYSDERYIVHPIRVMETCSAYTNKIQILAAALLHDVLEDTPVTEEELFSFLETVMDNEVAKQTLELVVKLTDVYIKEAYPHLNRKQRKEKETLRIAQTSADSQTIKYADILDNCKEIAASDPNFAPRFLNECMTILKVATKGDKHLYEKVYKEVETELQNLRKR